MVERIEGKSQIITLFNKYKDTFDNFIDSSDAMSLNRLRPINKVLYNISESESKPVKVGLELKKYFLNKDFSNRSLQ